MVLGGRLDGLAMPISYICLIGALYINNGYYHPLSLVLLGAGIALSYYYYYRYYIKCSTSPAKRQVWTKTGLLTLFVISLFVLAIRRYHLSLMASPTCRIIVFVLFFVEAVLIARPGKGSLYVLCGLVFLHNLIYSLSCGVPPIDVYRFVNEGARCILNLGNPYTHLYPQIYAPGDIPLLYGSHVSSGGGGIAFQPYMPMALFLSVPGAILGDIRIVTIAAFATIPIVLYGMVRAMNLSMGASQKRLLCAVPLFFPLQGHFLFQAWNDALPCLFFVLFVYCFLRKHRFLSYASLAMMIGLKQYTVFFVVPMLFLMNVKDYKLPMAMFLFLVAPLAVFAFVDSSALINSLIIFQVNQPFRPESLSLITAIYAVFGIKIVTTTLYFAINIAANVAFAFLQRKKRPDIPAAVFSSYVLFSLFLLLSKQSFLNYYFVLSTMLYCSIILSLKPPNLSAPETFSPCRGR
jgi:hypothetical protein